MNGPYIEQEQKQNRNQINVFRRISYLDLIIYFVTVIGQPGIRVSIRMSHFRHFYVPTNALRDKNSRLRRKKKKRKNGKRKKGKKEKISGTVRHNKKKIKKLKKTSRNNKAFKTFFIHNLTCLFLSSSCSNFFSSRNFVSSIFNSCSLIVSLFAFVMNTGLITSSSSSSSSVSVSYSESDGSGSSIFDMRAYQLLIKYF